MAKFKWKYANHDNPTNAHSWMRYWNGMKGSLELQVHSLLILSNKTILAWNQSLWFFFLSHAKTYVMWVIFEEINLAHNMMMRGKYFVLDSSLQVILGVPSSSFVCFWFCSHRNYYNWSRKWIDFKKIFVILNCYEKHAQRAQSVFMYHNKWYCWLQWVFPTISQSANLESFFVFSKLNP